VILSLSLRNCDGRPRLAELDSLSPGSLVSSSASRRCARRGDCGAQMSGFVVLLKQ
jgi:hypothetical protein